MVYHGHVKNGSIIIDDPTAQLEEGTKVEVHVPPSCDSDAKPVSERSWLRFSGTIDDLPPDASMRIDELLYGRPPE
jgi:hypothetical protein